MAHAVVAPSTVSVIAAAMVFASGLLAGESHEHELGAIDAAVSADGFAAIDNTPRDRRVVVVDRDGRRERRFAVPVTAAQARLVGAHGGVAIAWHASDKVKLAPINSDGTLGTATTWGKRVERLCEGAATSGQQFGIGWVERGGRLFILQGPVAATELRGGSATWCRIAAAGKSDLAVVWDDGRRVYLGRCNARGCERPVQIAVGESVLVGIACTREDCVYVARMESGDAEIAKLSIRTGRIAWRKPFAVEDDGQWFSLTAIGDTAFAIGYLARGGAVVQRVRASGAIDRIWNDPYSRDAPAIAWADDRLFVAHRHASIAPEVIRLPRE